LAPANAPVNYLTRLNITDGVLDLGDSELRVDGSNQVGIQVPSGNGTVNASGTGFIGLALGRQGAANGSTLTINARMSGAYSWVSSFTANGTGVTVLNNLNNPKNGNDGTDRA
jgi:hypothetical protein